MLWVWWTGLPMGRLTWKPHQSSWTIGKSWHHHIALIVQCPKWCIPTGDVGVVESSHVILSTVECYHNRAWKWGEMGWLCSHTKLKAIESGVDIGPQCVDLSPQNIDLSPQSIDLSCEAFNACSQAPNCFKNTLAITESGDIGNQGDLTWGVSKSCRWGGKSSRKFSNIRLRVHIE